MPTITFCMPTYNYGRYIGAALESIRAQAVNGVEVLVLDGASTDDTAAVVQRIAAEWPAVRYVRQQARGGIDADLARSVELARGEYCWLLSADDALCTGALSRISRAFGQGYEILLCNRMWCDPDLKPIAAQAWLKGERHDQEVNLSRAPELAAYLERAQSLGALFSFMSCIGFRRERWMQAAPPTAVACYTHVGRLFAMGRGGARMLYIAEPLILCRGGTDSFRAGGVASRLLIDLHGFRELASAIFPRDERARRLFTAVMRREHPLRQWLRARLETPDSAQWAQVERELDGYGFTRLERSLINALAAPLAHLRAAMSKSRTAH